MAAPFLTSVPSVPDLPFDPPAAAPRAQPVLHIAPLDARTVVAALAPALPRVLAGTAGVQALVVLPDADLGVEAAELMPGALSAFTSSHRGGRLLAHAAPAVIAASLTDIATLVRGAQLKLDAVVAVVIAGADVLLARDVDSLDALLAEVPADALRIATAASETPALASFTERHLRRARRESDAAVAASVSVPVSGLTVGAGGRPSALRALLDAFDPPSSAIVVSSESDAREARGALAPIGLSGVEPLAAVVMADAVPANVALLVCWRLPADAAQIALLAATTPVRFVVLHDVSERARLAALTGGALVPIDLPAPLESIRRRDALIRGELERELTTGAPLREAQVIAPLLAQHDGVAIAAAAVRILERERAFVTAQRQAAKVAAAPSAPAERGERTARPRFSDREERGARPSRPAFGDRSERAPRGERPARGDGPPRGERPPRGKFGDRDSGPPRGRKFGERDAGAPRGGKFADRGERGSRPPRSGGKFGDRDSTGPRGPSRDARGPAEGGSQGEWANRGEAMRRAKKPPREE